MGIIYFYKSTTNYAYALYICLIFTGMEKIKKETKRKIGPPPHVR
jgi:hypothetical protein